MTILEDKSEAKLSIFFKLQFGESILQNILDKIDDYEVIGEKMQSKVGQIAVGPVQIKLGNLIIDDCEYQFHYSFDRFVLEIYGDIENFDIVFTSVIKSFSSNFDIDQICRFMEFNSNEIFLNDDNLLEKLQKKITIQKPNKLEEIFQVSFLPWGISLASPKSPIDNEWFNIRILPIALSTSGKILVQIIKRTEKIPSEMGKFLVKIKTIKQDIADWLIE